MDLKISKVLIIKEHHKKQWQWNPARLNNDVPTSATTSSDTRTANYTKLIEEERKVINNMQEEDTYIRGES